MSRLGTFVLRVAVATNAADSTDNNKTGLTFIKYKSALYPLQVCFYRTCAITLAIRSIDKGREVKDGLNVIAMATREHNNVCSEWMNRYLRQ